MVTAGPLSSISPVISISMPVLDKNLEAQSPLIFIFPFHLDLTFYLLTFSIQICCCVSILRLSSAHTVSPRQLNRGNTFARAQFSSASLVFHFLSISLAASAAGPQRPASRQIGCHPILKIIKFDQACSNSLIIHLSLSPHLNDIIIIIRAAGAALIPSVHQYLAPVAIRPC